MSNNIKAVLVSISAPIMPNCREDKELTEEFRQNKKLGRKAGKWSKYRLPNHAFERMRKIASDFRNQVHYRLTLPWEDGKQLLPADASERYKAASAEARENFMTERGIFQLRYSGEYTVPRFSRDAEEYNALRESVGLAPLKGKSKNVTLPSLVDQAKIMHNGTFNPLLYPPWRSIADRFDFRVEYNPVPKASHFVTSGIAKDAVEEMRQELEQHNAVRIKTAVRETWERLINPIKAIAEKLSDDETVFRDSLIGNVREICTLVPLLNLTDDDVIVRAAKEIETKFANLDPEKLRTDIKVRGEVTASARKLVQHFGKIGARRFA